MINYYLNKLFTN